MIRFVIGLGLIMGSVGGLEMDTMSFTEFFMYTGVGLGLMVWALPKLAREE